MVGAEEAVADADLVVAAVVFVVAHEDVQLIVQGHVVDIPQMMAEDVQISPIRPAA